MVIRPSFPILLLSGLGSLAVALVWPDLCRASGNDSTPLDFTTAPVGYVALGIFVLAYALVMAEEFTHLRKSKPVILAAGIIWALVALSYPGSDPHVVERALRHNLLEYAELMLFQIGRAHV